jgi:outer membrane lipoprotein
MKPNHYGLFWLILLLISGCGPVISEQVRRDTDLALPFKEVLQAPSVFKGRKVIWGGEIIEALNKKEGDTQVVVLQTPLTGRGEPKEAKKSEGRFIFQASTYLDPQVYKKGRQVTVAGEIIGEETRPVGEMNYRYPVIKSREIYLWEDYSDYPPYFPYSYYYPYYYGKYQGGYYKGYGYPGKYYGK